MATSRLPDFEVGNENTFDYLCSPCKSKNKISEAVKYCEDCFDFYCSVCVKFHDDIPALRRHIILDKGQFSGSFGTKPALPTERCRQHGHKPVDMYCQEHDVVGCVVCMMTDHGLCANKTYAPDFVKKNIKIVDTSSGRMKLNNLVDCLRQSEKIFAEEMEKLIANKNRLIQDVKKLREDIDKRLDELVQDTITELEFKFSAIMSEVEDGRKRLRYLMKEAETCIYNIGSVTDNLTQQFVSLKLADSVTGCAEEKLNAIQNDVKSAKFDIFPQPEILAFIQQVDRLVKITKTNTPLLCEKFIAEKYNGKEGNARLHQRQITPSKSNMQGRKPGDERQPTFSEKTNMNIPDSKDSDVNSAAKEQKQRSKLLRVNAVNEHSVRVPSDNRSCDITGACVLEDGTVVLADNNNERLKRLDSSTFVVKDWCDIPKCPWQVCVVSSTEVAIACGLEFKILFVDVGSKMVTRHINTDFVCYGVACGGHKLYVSSDTFLYEYTLSGKRQQPFGKDQFGQTLSTKCYSLALSADRTTLYVADWDNGLLVLNKDGELISQYNCPQLQGARRVCLCQNGDVLVCGKKSNNVLQFSAEGNLIGEVLKGNNIFSDICCLQNGSKIMLCYGSGDNIEICDFV